MIENNELDLKFKKKIFNLIMFFNKENTWHKKLFPDLSSFTIACHVILYVIFECLKIKYLQIYLSLKFYQ
jgi:hypothetical protein